jgi:replicative DNA helicase
MARNFAFAGHPGVVFSMEMPKGQLMQRLFCDVGSIDGKYLFQGRLRKNDPPLWAKITEVGQDLAGLPVFWDDTANLSIDKIYSRAKKAKMLHGIKWIAVDYLQLLSGWGVPGQEGKAEITRQFKVMAKDLDLVAIVLSQLNRNIEGRASRAPQMSDLRDAGSIEQDCDIALFPDVPERSMDGTEEDGFDMAKLYIVKTRRGRTGVIEGLKWQGHYFRFSNGEAWS